MLDEMHTSLAQDHGDRNSYTLGRVGVHNVVMACLPAGGTGTISAARVASDMMRSFSSLKFGLMVGIGGAAPSREKDIRLGDVVVSHPDAASGGVIQYDFGKTVQGGRFVQTGILNKPPGKLRTALSRLQAKYLREGPELSKHLLQMAAQHPKMAPQYAHPGVENDILFDALYDHPEVEETCLKCDPSRIIRRQCRDSKDPVVYLGLIASGDRVMRDGATRDRLQREKKVDCFEMEAAGLMDDFPCLVIRGISDYSDSHKTKKWQAYAAAAAAAFAKELLNILETGEVDRISPVADPAEKAEAQACLRDLWQTDPSVDRDALKRRKGSPAPGTCEWILNTKELAGWLDSSQAVGQPPNVSNVLWLHGNPGTGKSTMAIFLTEELSTAFSATDARTLAYFFCDSGFETRKTATSLVRGLLLQLVKQRPQLLDYLLPKYIERKPEHKAELFESFDALWPIFVAAAADQDTGQKYCIIDALDECDQESQITLLRQFEETFRSENSMGNVRILITSRAYPEIREYLERFANKDLASFSERKRDVDRCIAERVAELAKRKRYTPKVIEQVSSVLTVKAEGTFLWIGLACKELEKVLSRDAVQVLQRMPKGLYSLYERLLDTARGEDGANADAVRRIMSCVAVSLRPLSVLELSEACQLHQEEEDIETRTQYTRDDIASCRLMVIVQDEKVLLLHQSVRDYLVGDGSCYFVKELEAHAYLAYRCVNILIKQSLGTQPLRSGFADYSIHNWPNHAHMAQSRFEITHSQAEFFNITSQSREQWLEHFRSYCSSCYHQTEVPRQFSILHVAGRWGIPVLVDYISGSYDQENVSRNLAGHIDLNCIDDAGETPLGEAVRSGHPRVASALLRLGAKLTPGVVKAAAANQAKGMEVMGILVNQRGDEITITEEVVKAAAGNTRSGKEVMTLLLNRQGDQGTITKEAVSQIARWFDGEVMMLLLNRRGDQVAITEEVVKAAAGNTRHGKEVMALLLDRQGDQVAITDTGNKTLEDEMESFDKLFGWQSYISDQSRGQPASQLAGLKRRRSYHGPEKR